MKTRLLLYYGYAIPIITSLVISLLPLYWGMSIYELIAGFFSKNIGSLLAFIAVLAAITWPFQSMILNEDNHHVLAVLAKSNSRQVFIRASIFQATLIVIMTLLLIILVSQSNTSHIVGYFELLALAVITFESIALVSNGGAYRNLREKIIEDVARSKKL